MLFSNTITPVWKMTFEFEEYLIFTQLILIPQYFVVSILYPLCSCMRFHCVCFSDLTVIHILYRSSFDVSGSQISLFPCSIILHGAAPHDSAGFLFQTEIIEFNFWFIVEITVANIVQMLSFLGLSRLARRDCSIPTSVTHTHWTSHKKD